MTSLPLVTCVSQPAVLAQRLLASPCVRAGRLTVTARAGCTSAAQAFNAALDQASAIGGERPAWLLWAHQDVYLPEGWSQRFLAALAAAETRLGPLAVVGVYGVQGTGGLAVRAGHVLHRGELLKEPTALPCLVDSLDELLFAVRTDSGLRLDPALGFDFYATDLVLQAQARGLQCAALDAFCEHWSATPGRNVPAAVGERIIRSAAVFERKWLHRLPVSTSCFNIDRAGDVQAFIAPLMAPSHLQSLAMISPLTCAIDYFSAEAHDPSEWRLAGWASAEGQNIDHAHIEHQGQLVAPLAYGWTRAVLPGLEQSSVGFTAHFFMPMELAPGKCTVHLVFFDESDVEVGRIEHSLVVDRAVSLRPLVARVQSPRLHPQADYLDLLGKTLLALPYSNKASARLRLDGRDWPDFAHSMIGLERLNHLRACAETVLHEGIPGDFMETGVWRGGACIMLRGVLRAFGDTRRSVWVADSFEGLPPPNPEKYPADLGDTLYQFTQLAVSLEEVQHNFRRYDLLDHQVKFLKGIFSQSLPNAPVDELALLRLDGDMYESTMDALRSLYPKLSPGGFCIVDDYGAVAACRQAVHDYRKDHHITAPIAMIDWTGAWWRRD